MVIDYRSIADMNDAIIKNLHKFPHDVDLVVGIPRSGMLPANLVALYLNKPFTDIDSFIEGKIYSSGERGRYIQKGEGCKILVMDDSIDSGNALSKAKRKIETALSESKNIYELLYGVVYATKKNVDKIDLYCEATDDGSRIFQWNIFHHDTILKMSYFDIDGVLCPNPPIDDDGPIYLNYITNAPLLYKPTVKISTLVSCRLEKYRSATEEWLHKNGILYDNLIMLNLNNKEERTKWGKHGTYKGKIYRDSDAVLFVESSYQEALEISKISHKPVFCTENFVMLNDKFAYTKKFLKNKLYTPLKILFKFFMHK